jgi:hypothetical protein
VIVTLFSVEPDFVETQATSTPYFSEAEPHPSSPAGGVQLWGSLARRVGPAGLRALLLGGLVVSAIVLLVALT